MKKMIFLKVKNSYNKKLVTWLDLNLQVALPDKDFRMIKVDDVTDMEFDSVMNTLKIICLK